MVIGVVVALLLALLSPAPGQPVPLPDQLQRAVLTSGGGRYVASYDGDRLVVAAPRHSSDPNRREVYYLPGTRSTRNQTSCATWSAQTSGMEQEGLAVRIREDGRRTRALTLTKNTIFDVHWVFNLLSWDTARRGDPWRAIGQYDMSAAVGRSVHHLYRLPWRACLRVTDRWIAFKVWPLGRVARPGWHDPTYSRRARLPQGWDVAGRPGWYVGHVSSGGRVVYSAMTTRPGQTG